ncbi:MliC family protein [soil metagenome]
MQMKPALLFLALALTACGSPPPTGTEQPTAATATTSAEAAGPSFECANAGDVEKLVCDDPELASLDRRLAAEYEHARASSDADPAVLDATENGWVTGRNDCWKADDVRRCVVEAYRTRLFELKVDDADTVTPETVTYRCPDPTKPFTAQFYNQFDPPAAVLSWGADKAVVFAERSGSGAKYGRDGVEYWEHQGEVTVDFYGNEFVCATP